MPYIDTEERVLLTPHSTAQPTNPGQLNFQLTEVVDNYIIVNGLSYRTINDVVGALESAKLEFYRRVATPYEDNKRMDNTDVYHKQLYKEKPHG